MGGERETVLSSPPASTKPRGQTTVSGIRMHENKGQVHFHDDKRKIKVAVPTDVFWKAWNNTPFDKGTAGNQVYRTMAMIDPTNKTVVVIDSSIHLSAKKTRLDTSVRVEKLTLDPNHQKIQDFIDAK